ncbi:MAG: 16S rRNA (guanine(966)-N(2))-methyltransferase RsmD, partial [Firmicutes bacterium]|nr:16S rRNA (guanine(966)-N(2))-methyltransferase RsmD [Bacillota bacterium]
MRIVAGRFRGRRLRGPSHPGLRPTAERVREAIFNILGPRVQGAVVLDLFAGAGGLGLEALSRGAKRVVFVERDRRALALLRRNLAELGLGGEEFEVIPGDVLVVLAGLAAGGRSFDLILADPPYGAGLSGRTLVLLAEGGLLDREGLLVLEHRSSEIVTPPQGLVLADR